MTYDIANLLDHLCRLAFTLIIVASGVTLGTLLRLLTDRGDDR